MTNGSATSSARPGLKTGLLSRLRAATLHLGLSAVVASLAALLVFVLWYPTPFRELSGGRELFFIVIAVDVILGPLITFAVFDRRKPRAELVRDLTVVVLLQLAALLYGLHAVAQARPAVVALEGSRLRVVRAIDLDDALLEKAPAGLQTLSLTGPLFVATRRPTDSERLESIERGLAGQDIGMRPEFWLPLAQGGAAYAAAAMPIERLRTLQPKHVAELNAAIAAHRNTDVGIGYLPMLARRTDWSALIDLKDGSVIGYVPIEGF
jgi:hypothetical protein